MRLKHSAILAVMAMFAFFFTPCWSSPALTASESLRSIHFSHKIQNTTDASLQNIAFWLHTPLKHMANQRLINLEINYPFELITDEFGNQIAHIQWRNLAPFDAKIVQVQADLKMSPTPIPEPLDRPEGFLGSEKFIETQAPEIAELAQKLKTSQPTDTAKKIFDHVSRNLKYTGYIRNARGALWALKNKQGDCTEFMYLFIALCRACGIPARPIDGVVMNQNGVIHPTDFHNWAEFYASGAWHIADPQRKVFMTNASDYISFRIIGDSNKNPVEIHRRFRFSGGAVKITMN